MIHVDTDDPIVEAFYELLLVDLLDSLVQTGDIDPQRANLIKASHFMDKYLKEEEHKNASS